MEKKLCIYHGGCDDGFAAAWAVRDALGDQVEFVAGHHGFDPPDVSGRDVILVDFSYKRPILEQMIQKSASLLVIDHHKTAQEDLDFLPLVSYFDTNLPSASAIFDMKRSGAGLTWDFFHQGQPRPDFINYIEDRDLWRKALPDSDEFTVALRSYPQEFTVWDKLIAAGPGPLIEEGKIIQRYYRMRVEEFKRNAYRSEISGIPCMAANAPYFAASEVAGELATEPEMKFGLCYFDAGNGEYNYSLRSHGDFDVSYIAKTFGGGGHKNAAGFRSKTLVHRLVPSFTPMSHTDADLIKILDEELDRKNMFSIVATLRGNLSSDTWALSLIDAILAAMRRVRTVDEAKVSDALVQSSLEIWYRDRRMNLFTHVEEERMREILQAALAKAGG